MSEEVRVRFAPSPTGDLHLGGARTTLVNWLFARRHGGAFVVRVEDTDDERNVAGAAERIERQLEWLGLVPDESPVRGGDFGPYLQSERRGRHEDALDRLRREGRVYRCFCPPGAPGAKTPRGCPSSCADLSTVEADERERSDGPPAIRFALGDARREIEDLLRGEVSFAGAPAPDPVVVRADGRPTYLFACAVDDLDMRITHVIRGEDHLPNAWKQAEIRRSLGGGEIRWAHLPLVLGSDRTPLSKRHGPSSVGALQERGYLAEAIVLALGHLGMSPPEVDPGDDPLPRLVESFDLEKLSTAPATHDSGRLDHLNAAWMRALSGVDLAARSAAASISATLLGEDSAEPDWWPGLLELCCESQSTLRGGVDLAAAMLSATGVLDEAGEGYDQSLRGWLEAWPPEGLSEGDEESFKALGKEVRSATGLKGKVLFHPLRLALTGSGEGPMLSRLAPIIDSAARSGGSLVEVRTCRERLETATAADRRNG